MPQAQKIHPRRFRPSEAAMALIRKRYKAPEWAVLEEVRDSTGYQRHGRTAFADAIAMNLYPSRGMEVLGFEVKVSRGDWRRELKDPEKNAAIQQFCDRWWVVVTKDDIVKEGELPPTWGLVLAQGRELKPVVEAPKLEPKPLDRIFVAAVLRGAAHWVEYADKHGGNYQKGHDEGVAIGRANGESERTTLERDLTNLKAAVEVFRERSGVDIGHVWSAEKIGAAVKTVMAGDKAIDDARRRIGGALQLVRREAAVLEDLHREIGEGAP